MEHWQEPFVDRAADLASELASMVETLNEVVVDHLREAVDNGYEGRPPLDKNLQAARRSIEKAARLLGG